MFDSKKKVRFKFNLGVRVRDLTCGFEGVITARSQLLNGCLRYDVTPKVKKDGERGDTWSIDEQQLELVDDGINGKVKAKTGNEMTGGPAARLSDTHHA